MKFINAALLVATMITGAGCVSAAQNDIRSIQADCVNANHGRTFNENCDAPKLGWKGANGSDFLISR